MRGYPQFSFWIPRALASFKPRRNIPVSIGTTHKAGSHIIATVVAIAMIPAMITIVTIAVILIWSPRSLTCFWSLCWIMGYKIQCCNYLWDIPSRYDCYDRRNQFSYGRFDRHDRYGRATLIATIVEIEIFLCQRSWLLWSLRSLRSLWSPNRAISYHRWDR